MSAPGSSTKRALTRLNGNSRRQRFHAAEGQICLTAQRGGARVGGVPSLVSRRVANPSTPCRPDKFAECNVNARRYSQHALQRLNPTASNAQSGAVLCCVFQSFIDHLLRFAHIRMTGVWARLGLASETDRSGDCEMIGAGWMESPYLRNSAIGR